MTQKWTILEEGQEFFEKIWTCFVESVKLVSLSKRKNEDTKLMDSFFEHAGLSSFSSKGKYGKMSIFRGRYRFRNAQPVEKSA